MAFDINDLSGHVGDVLNATRTITDPWGFGITAEIKSTADLDWKTWDLARLAADPLARASREKASSIMVNQAETAGFRSAKKLTDAERKKKLVEAYSQPVGLKVDVVALREQKPGIAKLLVVELNVLRGGNPIPQTPEARLEVMDHVAYEFTGADGQKKQRAAPLYKRDENDDILLDDNDAPIELPYGGLNFGDAITAWLFAEADYQAGFVEARKKEIRDLSAGASNSSTETGSPSSQAPAEP